jgi:type VI secretion system protein ImpK
MSSKNDALNTRPGDPESTAQGETLALIYQGLLTGIVRIQSGKQHVSDAESFRRRTQAALGEIERDALAVGYDGNDIRETHFAVVAYLDAVILNSKEAIRAEWERKTLQEELFGQTDAGVVFFEKLERLRTRRDSRHLADALEVYLLCLLLGFEGRYAGGLRGELYSVTERLRTRIDDIRGSTRRLSPPAPSTPSIPSSIIPARHAAATPYILIMLSAVLLTLLLFAAAKANLILTSNEIRGRFF